MDENNGLHSKLVGYKLQKAHADRQASKLQDEKLTELSSDQEPRRKLIWIATTVLQ
jgi:hypothetical protein